MSKNFIPTINISPLIKNNFANIDTKKGEEKNKAFAVAKGIKVNEIKKAEKAIKCKITLNIVKKG